MSRSTQSLVVIFFFITFCTCAVQAQDRVNVIFAPGISALERAELAIRCGGVPHQDRPRHRALTLHASAASQQALAESVGVMMVEPDFVCEVNTNPASRSLPKDTSATATSNQTLPTGVNRIDAEAAFAMNAGAGVVVAVVDTGLDLTHPDLSPNIIGGYNAINNNSSANDDNGHGSHCGGTIAAADNTQGVVGVARQAKLLAVKVLDRRGSGYSSDIAEGIDWAADHGAQVISMSLGSSAPSSLIQAAVQRAAARQIVIVCAAGNEGWAAPGYSTVGWPAAFPECIAVSAWTDLDGTPAATGTTSPYGDLDESLASFSSTGPEVEVTAPGVSIYSTWKSGSYNTISGTSMACPHASGVVALLIAAGNADPRGALSATAVPVAGTSDQVGAGLIRASAGPVNYAPTVAITAPASGSTFPSGSPITFTATATDMEDGNLGAAVQWSSNLDGALGIGASLAATLSTGQHTITAAVSDSGSQSSTASITVYVGTPPPGLHAATITYATSGGGKRDLRVTVNMTNDQSGAVSGAAVSIALSLNGSVYATGSGTTGSNGSVSWVLRNAPSGTYSTAVVQASAPGLTWDGLTPVNSYVK